MSGVATREGYMSRVVNTDETIYLGIDGGGTKCRAVIVDAHGRRLGEGLGGPANPLHGLERTFSSIVDSAQQALVNAGLDQSDLSKLVAGVALAGVNISSTFSQVENWQYPFASMYLTTDLHAACLGAHCGEDGAVIVAGTGSCGYVCVEDRRCTLGGHGFLLGDVGSGSWLGLRALQAVLNALDGLAPTTMLSTSFERKFGLTGLAIVEAMSKSTSSEFAKLAPTVLEVAKSGDAVAQDIVQAGADYIDALARKLLSYQPPRLSMIGGISQPLKNWLSPQVVAKIAPPLEQPEMGAIYFAQERHGVNIETIEA